MLPCEEQYAKKLQGSNLVPVCVPASVQLNGSAIPLYNSSSIYDKLLWAATWMYKATGDTDYLGDAESFYIRHIYDEGAPDVRPFSFPCAAHSSCCSHCSQSGLHVRNSLLFIAGMPLKKLAPALAWPSTLHTPAVP